jgi:hypothetical protein
VVLISSGQSMKRPLLPVALCYAGGLLLAEAVQPPLLWLFAASFSLLLIAVLFSRVRLLMLWPLIMLVGCESHRHRFTA